MIKVEVQKPSIVEFTEEEYIRHILGDIPDRKPKYEIGDLVIPATGKLGDFKAPMVVVTVRYVSILNGYQYSYGVQRFSGSIDSYNERELLPFG